MLSDLRRRKLTKLFAMHDASNSGVLKFANYELIVRRIADLRGYKNNSPECEQLTSKYAYQWIQMRGALKKKLRKDMGGKITLDEWLAYYEEVLQDGQEENQKQIASLDNFLFDVVDADGSGNLHLEEWKSLYYIFSIPVVYADETFQIIDRDNNGDISREELHPLLSEFFYSEDENALGNRIFGPI